MANRIILVVMALSSLALMVSADDLSWEDQYISILVGNDYAAQATRLQIIDLAFTKPTNQNYLEDHVKVQKYLAVSDISQDKCDVKPLTEHADMIERLSRRFHLANYLKYYFGKQLTLCKDQVWTGANQPSPFLQQRIASWEKLL